MARLLLSGVAVCLLLAGCSSGGDKKVVPRESSAAFVDICGRKFNEGQSFLEDASAHDIVVNRTSPGDDVVLQLSHDCKADVNYHIVPSNAATVVRSAPVDKPVFLILHPTAQKFTVTFQRPSGPGKVTVDFTQPTTSLPS